MSYEAALGCSFPATEADDRRVRKAGGLINMSDEDRAKVAYKRLEPGDKVTKKSVPKLSWAVLTAQGAIVSVPKDEED